MMCWIVTVVVRNNTSHVINIPTPTRSKIISVDVVGEREKSPTIDHHWINDAMYMLQLHSVDKFLWRLKHFAAIGLLKRSNYAI